MLNFLNRFKKPENNDESYNAPVTPPQPVYSPDFKQLTDAISNITKSIRNIESRTHNITEKLETISEKVEIHDRELNSMKNSFEKMFALYDALMQSYNPFIEEPVKNNSSQTIQIETNSNSSKNNISSEKLPLDQIKNDPSFIAIVMGWLNYLVRKSNLEEAADALEYYASIGWITEDVKIVLQKYLQGFRNIPVEDQPLTPEDHLVSLYIITKLKDGLESEVVRFKELYEELINRGIIKPVR